MDQVVFVVGSGGTIGANVARWFVRRGYKVYGMDDDTRGRLYGPRFSTVNTIAELKKEGYIHIRGSAADQKTVEAVMESICPDVLVLAAGAITDAPMDEYLSNVQAHLVPALAYEYVNPGGRIIMFSGVRYLPVESAEFPTRYDAEGFYGFSEDDTIEQGLESDIEEKIRNMALRSMHVAILRVDQVVGAWPEPHHSWVYDAIVGGMRNHMIGVNDPRSVAGAVHPTDVARLCEAIVAAEETFVIDELYNVGGEVENALSARELQTLMEVVLPTTINSVFVDETLDPEPDVYFLHNALVAEDFEFERVYGLEEIIAEVAQAVVDREFRK